MLIKKLLTYFEMGGLNLTKFSWLHLVLICFTEVRPSKAATVNIVL